MRLSDCLDSSSVVALETTWNIIHSEFSLGWGGQERRILTELLAFRARGAQVGLIAPESSEIFRRCAGEDIDRLALPTNKLLLPIFIPAIADWIGRRGADVVNTHSSRDGWFVGLAARLAGVPLLVRSRHIDITYRNRFFSRLPFTALANHVLCTSSDIERNLTNRFDLESDRISTIATGIDTDRFAREGPMAGLYSGCPAGRLRVGIVSVLRAWKGHKSLIKAIRLLRNRGRKVQLIIVGDGPSRAWIESLVHENGLAEDTLQPGYVEDVAPVLRGLDVLAIPSMSHEGIPQIGLQALACETPVVGSDFGGIPEIIRHDETGTIFPRGNAGALADALCKVLDQPERTRRLVRQGRQFVEREYSIARMVERTEAIYTRYLSVKQPQ